MLESLPIERHFVWRDLYGIFRGFKGACFGSYWIVGDCGDGCEYSMQSWRSYRPF
jgi:hypothetical protein